MVITAANDTIGETVPVKYTRILTNFAQIA